MTVWCIEYLHRLPCELLVPTSLVLAGMVAHAVIVQERVEEMERARDRAESGW